MATYTFHITLPQVVDSLTVELPYFCNEGSSFYAMLDEKTIISVNDWQSIGQANIWLYKEVPLGMKSPNCKPIERSEFMEKYNSVIAKMIEKL